MFLYVTIHPDNSSLFTQSKDGACIKVALKGKENVDRKRKRPASEPAEDFMESDEDEDDKTKFRSEAKTRRHEGPSIFRFGRSTAESACLFAGCSRRISCCLFALVPLCCLLPAAAGSLLLRLPAGA